MDDCKMQLKVVYEATNLISDQARGQMPGNRHLLNLRSLLGLVMFLVAGVPAGASSLVPASTPFGYNVGIDYETDVDGRTGRSISDDLDQITQYFELVRTYHDTADPNSTTPTIDPNEAEVIQYAMSHPAMSLVIGTYNSALVLGSTGNSCGVATSGSFSAGLMDSQAYTNAWVQMLISAFGGSTSAVIHTVKTILLGNEIDLPGPFMPGPGDTNYSNYINTWIPTAFANLKTSLSNAGLGSIPISVTLAFSPISDSIPCPGSNRVSTAIPQYISANWSASWNGGQPFVLYDQYSNSSPPTFNDITGYLQQVVASPSVNNEVFLGETGVQSSGSDDTEEANFYQEMFAFLASEWRNGGITLPAFAFQAFDLPAENQSYGLFAQNANFQPTGLKSGISIPCWVTQPLTALAHDFNCDGKSDILWEDTSGDTAMWLMNGASILQSAGVGTVSPTVWSIVGQRDFNGDGYADILWRDSSGDVAIWLMNGATILQSLGVGNAPTSWSIVGTGDFFGNGNGGILWRDTSGDVAIWELSGNTIVQSCGVGTAPTSWSIAGTGDFNGDGKTDILWHDTSGDVAIWEMNGCSILQSAGVGTVNPSVWSIAGTGDFNGDGMSSILWHDASGDVAIWEMNGPTISQSLGVGTANPSVWSIAQTGDYYGAGTSDILWRDTSGDVAVWQMNGAMIVQSAGIGTAPTVWSIQGAGAD